MIPSPSPPVAPLHIYNKQKTFTLYKCLTKASSTTKVFTTGGKRAYLFTARGTNYCWNDDHQVRALLSPMLAAPSWGTFWLFYSHSASPTASTSIANPNGLARTEVQIATLFVPLFLTRNSLVAEYPIGRVRTWANCCIETFGLLWSNLHF